MCCSDDKPVPQSGVDNSSVIHYDCRDCWQDYEELTVFAVVLDLNHMAVNIQI